jgi:uncharacterized membrane protein
MDGILGGIISIIFGHPLPGVGFLVTITLIFITGYFANYIIGERFIRFLESFLYKVPIVKSIYSSTKQINDVFFQSEKKHGFQKACLVQYPREGIYSLGFITTTAALEIQHKVNNENLLCVFIPNTPTPATGFLIMVPAKDVIMLDIKTEDAFKLVVSGGVLKPKEKMPT